MASSISESFIQPSSSSSYVSVEPLQEQQRQSAYSLDELDDDDTSGSSGWGSDSEDEEEEETKADRAAREQERQLVLEAAGLIVKRDVNVVPPPRPVRRKSAKARRPAPAAPTTRKSTMGSSPSSPSAEKHLPPIPHPEPLDSAAHLDDAFERYESFRQSQIRTNRLSVASMESGAPSSPTTSPMVSSPSRDSETGGRSYSHILSFLGRKTPVAEGRTMPVISAPILQPPLEDSNRPTSPAFGSVSSIFIWFT